MFNNGWEFHSAGTRDSEAYDAVQKFGPTWIYNGKNDSGETFRLIYSCGGGSLGSGFGIYSPGFETRYSKEHPYEFVITNNGDYLRRNYVTIVLVIRLLLVPNVMPISITILLLMYPSVASLMITPVLQLLIPILVVW